MARVRSGFTPYRTPVEPADRVVVVEEVRDRAVALLDVDPLGVLSGSDVTRALTLQACGRCGDRVRVRLSRANRLAE